MEAPISKQMTLEQYKQKVAEHLLKLSKDKAYTQTRMKDYDSDLKELFKENFSAEATATGILMGLL